MIFQKKKIPSETWTHPPTYIVISDVWIFFFAQLLRRQKKRWRYNTDEDMKKYRLTEDMAQNRNYWMTGILAGPAQGHGQER